MSQYFPKPYEPFGGDINVNLILMILTSMLIYLIMEQKLI